MHYKNVRKAFSELLSSSPRRLEATSCTVTSGSWLAWLRRAGLTTCWMKSRMWTSSWTTDTCWSEERTSPRSSGSDPPSLSASGTTSSAADTMRWSTQPECLLHVNFKCVVFAFKGEKKTTFVRVAFWFQGSCWIQFQVDKITRFVKNQGLLLSFFFTTCFYSPNCSLFTRKSNL